jgi:Tol biopolymer transport system component
MFYNLSRPAWSPDGSRILFSAALNVPGPCGSCWADQQVYIGNADGSGLRRVASQTESIPPGLTMIESDAAWSPDGRRIALNRWVGPAGTYEYPWDRGGLVVVDVDNGVEREIGGELSFEYWTWSPDGRSILLGRVHLNGTDRIVIVDVESGDTSLVPWDHLSAPSWQRLAQ